MAPPMLVLGIAQARNVIDGREPLDEDDEYSKRKHNPMMPQIVPNEKPYHEQKNQPSLIGNVGELPTYRQIVPMNNSGDGSFSSDGNRLPKGNGGNLPRGGGNKPLEDQNPISYAIRPTRP